MINKFIKNSVLCLILASFSVNSALTPAYTQELLNLPVPGAMVAPSKIFTPPLLKGVIIDPENPFHFDFIIDTGDQAPDAIALEAESKKIIQYFMASLTVPEEDLWVNLSPMEKDRIIPDKFGQTEMGRDLLAQDYILKQLTASLMYPEETPGKKFWKTVREKALARYGTTDIPVDAFNKVWIVPESAVIYEDQDIACIQESRLKVMLESDYQGSANETHDNPEETEFRREVLKEIIIPEIEREVNQGAHFAQLRQIYHALILAAWFKENLKEAILNKVYADRNLVNGINIEDTDATSKIYRRYLEAFQKGVYDYIREEYDPATRTSTPKRYFSGGADFGKDISKKIIRKPLNKQSAGIVKKGIRGLVVLASALLLNSGSGLIDAGADQNLIVRINPDYLSNEQIDKKAFFPAEESLVRAAPLTDEEKKNINATARERVKSHLDLYRQNILSFAEPVIVTGLAAAPLLIDAILDEKEPWRVREEAAKLLYRIALAENRPDLVSVGETAEKDKPDPRIRTMVIPAALKILENVNNNDIRKIAAGILEQSNAQPKRPGDGQAYIGYLLAHEKWDALAEAGAAALDLLLKAVNDNGLPFKQDLFWTIGVISASLPDQDYVTQRVIPLMIEKASSEKYIEDTSPYTVLGMIASSPHCDKKAIQKISLFLIDEAAESTMTGENSPFRALARIAASVPDSNPLKKQITGLLLAAPGDVSGELILVARSFSQPNPVKDMIINKFRGNLTNPEPSVRLHGADVLKKIGWEPLLPEDKKIFYYAGRQWKELTAMGPEAVDFLISRLKDRNPDQAIENTIFTIIAKMDGDADTAGKKHFVKTRVIQPVLDLIARREISAGIIIKGAGQAIIDLQEPEFTKKHLLPFLLDENLGIRSFALLKNAALQLKDDPVLEEKIIPTLVHSLFFSEWFRLHAAMVLENIREEVPEESPARLAIINSILNGIRNKDGISADWAISSLAKMGLTDLPLLKNEIIPVIFNYGLKDENDEVFNQAVDAIGTVSQSIGADPEGILKNHLLPAILKLYEEDKGIATWAIWAVGFNLSNEHPQKRLFLNLSYRWAELGKGVISLQDYLLIYSNKEFSKMTKDLHSVNQFSVARAVDTVLKTHGLGLDDEKISALIPFILKIREDFLEKTLLDRGYSVIIGTNDDSLIFSTEYIKNFISQFIGARPGEDSFDKRVKAYDGLAYYGKDALRKEIRTSPGKTFIYLNGHGGPNHFWLRGGQEGKEKSENLSHPDGISYKELADDLIERASGSGGVLSDLVIMIDSCYCGDYATRVLNLLQKASITITDSFSIVTAANRGTQATGFSESEEDPRSTMLKGIKEATGEDSELKGKHIVRAETIEKIAFREDLTIFITLTPEQQRQLRALLGVNHNGDGSVRYFSFGQKEDRVTEPFLNETIPVLAGLIGKNAHGEIVSNDDGGEDELHLYDRENHLLGVRDLITVENGRGHLETALTGLKNESVNPHNQQIIDAFLRLLENSPPELRLFTDPVADFLGIASFEKKLIALARDLSDNSISIFHELGEYYVQGEILKLSFDGEWLVITADGKTARLHLQGKARSIALKGKTFSGGKDAYHPHYLLRALQYAMFGGHDELLTKKIKQIKQSVDSARTGADQPPGGIDLNPSRLKLGRRGQGIRLNIPDELRVNPELPIQGLTPVIIQIQPVYDLPVLLNQ
ncbi:MAG: hypothetical protein AB1650_08050 [Candidatus Omnitrophota bacterium]